MARTRQDSFALGSELVVNCAAVTARFRVSGAVNDDELSTWMTYDAAPDTADHLKVTAEPWLTRAPDEGADSVGAASGPDEVEPVTVIVRVSDQGPARKALSYARARQYNVPLGNELVVSSDVAYKNESTTVVANDGDVEIWIWSLVSSSVQSKRTA